MLAVRPGDHSAHGHIMVRMTDVPIHYDSQALADLCHRYGIRRLAFFGSVLRSDFRQESDVDVLVEFDPQAIVGLKFMAIERELGELFGRRVDLNTPDFLSPSLRGQVLAQARDVYVAA